MLLDVNMTEMLNTPVYLIEKAIGFNGHVYNITHYLGEQHPDVNETLYMHIWVGVVRIPETNEEIAVYTSNYGLETNHVIWHDMPFDYDETRLLQ